jgi:hypothetical protein
VVRVLLSNSGKYFCRPVDFKHVVKTPVTAETGLAVLKIRH